MAPKEEPKQHVTLGRVGTTLQMGIVGLPNVGKSTFFNVLTNSSVPAENFPFCTIDPSTSRVEVPDDRFNWLVEHWKPASAVPAVLNVTDIAGLVKGANNGEGLGNAFLSHIKAVDGIFHMVRVFEDAEVTHVEGNVDPVRDMEIITSELMLKDIQFLEGKKETLSKLVKQHKEKKPELDVVERCLQLLQEEKLEIRFAEWKALDIEILNTFQLLTAKPVVFLCNMTPDNYIKKKNKWLPKIKEWIDRKSGNTEVLIPFSAQFEQKIQEMSEEDRKKYLQETNTVSALPKIIHAGYNALQLIHYFTSGTDEVKCWTIKRGTKAPQAAGKIHTDFEKNFIMAEVMRFDDYKESGSENACKAAGKLLQKGREYVVDDGDIMFFKFGKK